MLLVSHVCAEFHDAKGVNTFSITPSMIRGFIIAPEFIREDPLFHLLLRDGSVEYGVSEERKRVLENDPAEGMDAAGRAIPADEIPEKPARAGRSAKSAKADKPEPAQPVTEPSGKT